MILNKKIFIIVIFYTNMHAFTLEEGFNHALENNAELLENINNVKIDEISLDIAKRLNYPRIDLVSNYNLIGQENNDYSEEQKDDYKIVLKQKLLDGNKAKNEKEIKNFKLLSSKDYLLQFKNELALNYTRNYINALREDEILKLTKEAITVSKKYLEKVKTKLSQGYGTKLEYNEIKAKLIKNEIAYSNEKFIYDEAVENLDFYIHLKLDTSEMEKPKIDFKKYDDFDLVLKKALKQNFSLKIAKINIDIARAKIKEKSDKDFPTLDLALSYNLENQFLKKENKNSNYELGLQFNYNLYNGGKDSLEEKRLRSELKNKKYALKKIENEIKKNLAISWHDLKSNEKKYKQSKLYVVSRREIFYGTKEEFGLGFKDLVSVLTSYEEYLDAKQTYIKDHYDLLLSKYQILASMGILGEYLKEEIKKSKKRD